MVSHLEAFKSRIGFYGVGIRFVPDKNSGESQILLIDRRNDNLLLKCKSLVEAEAFFGNYLKLERVKVEE